MSAATKVILNFGLFRSASTWAFNVTADIARMAGPVQTLFAESGRDLAKQLAPEAGCAVVKSHVPEADLRLLARLSGAPAILTIREPLDCVASLVEQFGESFGHACADVAASTEASLALLDIISPLVLRYEAQGAREAQDVGAIAQRLAVDLGAEDAARIAERYRLDQVRAVVDALMVAGTFDDRPPRDQFDPKSHWHPGHVGLATVGRHSDVLSPAQAAVVAYATRAFRQRLGYQTLPAPGLPSGASLSFAGEALAYCEAGFCTSEGWGLWTEGEAARLAFPLAQPARSLALTLLCNLAPIFRAASQARLRVYLNGRLSAELLASERLPETLALTLASHDREVDCAEVVFRFDGLVEVDPRRLGLGLIHLDLRYNG